MAVCLRLTQRRRRRFAHQAALLRFLQLDAVAGRGVDVALAGERTASAALVAAAGRAVVGLLGCFEGVVAVIGSKRRVVRGCAGARRAVVAVHARLRRPLGTLGVVDRVVVKRVDRLLVGRLAGALADLVRSCSRLLEESSTSGLLGLLRLVVDASILRIHETLDATRHVDGVVGRRARDERVHGRARVKRDIGHVGVAGQGVGQGKTRVVSLLVPSVGQPLGSGEASLDVV